MSFIPLDNKLIFTSLNNKSKYEISKGLFNLCRCPAEPIPPSTNMSDIKSLYSSPKKRITALFLPQTLISEVGKPHNQMKWAKTSFVSLEVFVNWSFDFSSKFLLPVSGLSTKADTQLFKFSI